MTRKLTLCALALLLPAFAFAAPVSAPRATPTAANTTAPVKVNKARATMKKMSQKDRVALKREYMQKRAAEAAKATK
jgi:hypothetical protein